MLLSWYRKGSGQCCVLYALKHQGSAIWEEMEHFRDLSCLTSMDWGENSKLEVFWKASLLGFVSHQGNNKSIWFVFHLYLWRLFSCSYGTRRGRYSSSLYRSKNSEYWNSFVLVCTFPGNYGTEMDDDDSLRNYLLFNVLSQNWFK